MAEVSAAAVKSLRERTGLPMMKCKEALTKAGGDQEAAELILRKEGAKFSESRGERETLSGRIEIFADMKSPSGAIVELNCESAPVAKNEAFRQLAVDLARQAALGPSAATPEALLAQPSPSQQGKTLGDQLLDLQNQIREVFHVRRVLRVEGACGGYTHHDGAKAALIQVQGGDAETVKEVGMQVVSRRPLVVKIDELDPAVVAKEREILSEVSRKEGKPENIIAKMVEGRLRNFYAEKVLLEQPFVKDEATTVGKLAKSKNLTILRFVYWELGGK
ncbi:MAG: translation elongation factor Ts [Planctomycetia bacterium]|nr:translation elongation factor Ts [Planctomycetia bacterium]